MNIFNSLGSNYDLNFVLRALFAQNKNLYREELIKFLGKKYEGKAILVYKGRETIRVALEILKLPKESQVAINGFTCFAVYKAVETAGYEAVCLDLEHKFPNRHSGDSERSVEDSRIPNGNKRFRPCQNDELDLNFSANELLKAIKQNPKIKVVIIQNTLGYPCDIENIAKTCKENNLILIEDLAHSVGAIYVNGKEAGTIGDFVVLSFSQDKIIDAVSGGALIIRNKKYHDYTLSRGETLSLKQQLIDRFYPLFTFIIRKTYKMGVGKLIHFLLRNANLLSKPMDESFYAKYDLPNWYSCLVMDSFIHLKKNLDHRRTIASIYNSILNKKITSSIINQNIRLSSNLRYPIFVDNRKALIEYLKKEEVYVSDIWYDSVSKECNNCKMVADKILNLPTYKNISIEDAKLLSKKINQWLQSQ